MRQPVRLGEGGELAIRVAAGAALCAEPEMSVRSLKSAGNLIARESVSGSQRLHRVTVVAAGATLSAQPDVPVAILENVGDFVVGQPVLNRQVVEPFAIVDARPALDAKPYSAVRRFEGAGHLIVGETVFRCEGFEILAVEGGDASTIGSAPDIAGAILHQTPDEATTKTIGGVVRAPRTRTAGRPGVTRPEGSGIEL